VNGVGGLENLPQGALGQLEPEVRGRAALWSPSTGIVDSHGLMLALLGDFENAGGALVLKSAVRGFRRVAGGFEIDVDSGGEPMVLNSNVLINSAGHGAIALAATAGLADLPGSYYPAGHYYSYRGKSPFSHLVYPVAGPGSLGIHATLDLGGQLKFGPDVDWRDKLDYRFDSSAARLQSFANSVRDYFPGLEAERLLPGYVGVRPRITAPGVALADFRIVGPETHGIDGLVQLFGIESPGLTACLAIADEVASRLKRN
jgi:L-2-hydroxyglutarate oxidase LhgO